MVTLKPYGKTLEIIIELNCKSISRTFRGWCRRSNHFYVAIIPMFKLFEGHNANSSTYYKLDSERKLLRRECFTSVEFSLFNVEENSEEAICKDDNEIIRSTGKNV